MSDTPADLKYSPSHEWVRLEENGSITVGITDFAQDALGDIVFVELPEVNMRLEVGEEAGVVESVKAASDTYAPVAGVVVEVNAILEEEPERVNQKPYADGWFYRLEPHDISDLEDLIDAETYLGLCKEEAP
ncbi:MAG: glycine cleavage system protein GcvH [Pseudomonadales bacterium]|nr:glycine cleavage system protein GcvH [Pseudomonadales bacterium]